MARILVTGSEGSLGKPLVKELRKRGHEVWGCDLMHSPDPQYFRCDIAEYRQLEAFFLNPPDFVYNLAGEFGRLNGQEYPEQLWRTNCLGLRTLIDLCIDYKVGLIHASSSEAYGSISSPMCEEDGRDIVPQFHNEYALTKWTNEKQLEIGKARGLKAVALRFFNVYGPGEYYSPYRSVVCQFIYKLLHGETITVYDGSRDFLFVDDWTRTVANVCEREWKEPVYNIGGCESVDIGQLANAILDCGIEGRNLVALAGEEPRNVKNKKPDIALAIRDFDHSPTTSLQEGIRKTLNWMRGTYGVERQVHQSCS
jgi:dTDP-glucose 4,6-dehydratase